MIKSIYLIYYNLIIVKLNAKYENIKADYFSEIVFNNLEKKKTLNILKYNKNIE